MSVRDWLELFRLVRDLGLEVVLPIIRAIHSGDETTAQALSSTAAGRAAYEASKKAGHAQ